MVVVVVLLAVLLSIASPGVAFIAHSNVFFFSIIYFASLPLDDKTETHRAVWKCVFLVF